MSETTNKIPEPAPSLADTLFLHGNGGDLRVDLLDYWRTLTKHKFAIAGFAAAVTLLAIVVVMVMTPIYRASTTILIEPNKQRVMASIEDVYSGAGSTREYFQTQVEILKSRDVMERAVRRLALYDVEEFDPRQPKKGLAAVLEQIGFSTTEEPPEWDEATLSAAAAAAFEKKVTITPIRLSQLIEIGFDNQDPALAARAANALASAFIEKDLDARYDMTRQASVWLQGRLGSLKTDLDKSEEALQDYREKHKIAEVKGVAQSGASDTITQLTMQLVNARAQRAAAEESYKLIKKATTDGTLASLPTVQRSQIVAEAKRQEAEADRTMSDVTQRYGKKHPKFQQAEGALNTAHDNVSRQIDVVVASITQEYEAAKGTERALERTLAEAQGAVVSLNRKEFGLTALERDAEANRQMYNSFVNRAKETSIAQDMQTTVARVVDVATLPKAPVKPKKSLTVAIAMVLGVLLGAMIALLLEMLDNTFKTADDVESRLRQPLLTVLPLLSKKEMERTVSGTQILAAPNSLYSEAVRTARTGILLSSVDSPRRSLLVTSSVPGEGKTTFAVNLALAHAHTKKTLLVDADLRRPAVGKAFGFEPTAKGLSDLVAGTAKLNECLHRIKDSNLVIISSGVIPPNPLELLHSERFRETLQSLMQHFDVVVIDSAPVELVSDALVIADQATGVLFVTRAMSTPVPLARKALQRIRRAHGNIIGVVLNALDFNKAEKYYGEYSGYGKKYGADSYHGGYGATYGSVPASPDLSA